ncbi:MAG: hypothetical protein P4L51_24830 [Puia sp.]|nr:hypothetical protein [Puia sp.]
MKKLFYAFLAAALSCTHANAQEFREHISREFNPSKEASSTVLAIYNIDGPVLVEGYAGTKVFVEVDKLITADDNEELENGKKEFKLEFEQTTDTITAYIAEPHDSRPRSHSHQRDGWDIKYRYHLNFTVKVPFGMNLAVSTVNNGDITVKDVAGTLRVNNVNGSLYISNAKGITRANTVNGKVEVSYLVTPGGESSYHTINGEIRVTYPANLSADLQFKSLNGGFFTDFPNAEALPGKVTKVQEFGSGATVYKLNKISSVRIGEGGTPFKFETINGDIYIKRQS